MIPLTGGLLSPEFGKEIDEAGLDPFSKFWAIARLNRRRTSKGSTLNAKKNGATHAPTASRCWRRDVSADDFPDWGELSTNACVDKSASDAAGTGSNGAPGRKAGHASRNGGSQMENALDMGDEAFRLAKKRRYSEALAICDKIIANWPHAYVGHYHKAVILQAKGELSDALKSMTRVVELMPRDAFPYYMRAGILMQMGRYSDALGDLVEAEDRDEERFLGSEIPLLKADCHCQLDQLD
ncbi:MAG: tetratricopeptide repeat protein, partial [Rhodospirillales bacterium]|nr:tetratricopeptide repeat protein [Rhodospirillales bacterium]